MAVQDPRKASIDTTTAITRMSRASSSMCERAAEQDKAARISATHGSPIMLARDVMVPRVISVTPDESVLGATRLMLQKGISGLPVIDGGGNLVGIVSEGDFLRRAETGTKRVRPRWLEFVLGPGRLAQEYVHVSSRKVGDVMTRNVRTVTSEARLAAVVDLMERYHIKRVPVIDGGKVVGIVTRANLLHAMASFIGEIAPSSATDSAIREKLIAELDKQPWAPVAMVDVTVRNGIVQISGSVTDDRQRQAMRVAAENIPGVRKVEEHFVWIDPVSGFYAEIPPDDEPGRPSTG
jgi:CBS domain-containing protein